MNGRLDVVAGLASMRLLNDKHGEYQWGSQ
jgi:hypothetical protein